MPLHLERSLIAGILMTLIVVGGTAHAETIYYYEPHTGFRKQVDSVNPGRYMQSDSPHAIVGGAERGGTLTFSIAYQDITDNTDAGFDSPSLGATRRATFEAVLDYVRTVLNETTGATLNVSVGLSQADGTGPLASAGTFYSGVTGFNNGHCFQHIVTGIDPSFASDITLTVDFGYPWNSDTGPVGASEFDLYSVLLHEVTHGLGFLGLTGSNGNSLITGGNPGAYAHINRLTQLDDVNPVGPGSSTPLWTTSGGASYVGAVANLTSGRLVFTGTNAAGIYGSNPTIYSGSPFISGSSLGHWGDAHFDLSVMPRSISNGAQNREYALFEKAALKDLGYSNIVVTADEIWVDLTWTGFQLGNVDNPLNTVTGGSNAVSNGGTLHILAGESNEVLTIDVPMLIEAEGGVVRIGEPSSRSRVNVPRTGFISSSSR